MTDYDTTSLPELSLAQFTARVPAQAQIADAMGELFGRLLPAMQQAGLNPAQPTVAWFDGTTGQVDLGVGLAGDDAPTLLATQAGLEAGTVPAAAKAVVTRHTGSLDGLQQAWAALHQHVAAQGEQPVGPCREIYLAGSIDQPDSWVIELQQPVA